MMATVRARRGIVAGMVACMLAGAVLGVQGVRAEGPDAGDWPGDLDCAACHVVEADSMEGIVPEKEEPKIAVPPGRAGSVVIAESDTEEDGEEVEPLAVTHAAVECAQCHDDGVLADVHASGEADAEMPEELSESVVGSATCLACHDDPDELANLTAESEALVDRNGTAVNPHELPDIPEHEDITCGNCHKMHGNEDISITSMETCATCHHERVFECGTCHEV